MRDLIGKPVRIEWRRPEDDWPTFTLLAYEPPMVRLQGRDDGEWKHEGDTFWVNVAEIVSIVPDFPTPPASGHGREGRNG